MKRLSLCLLFAYLPCLAASIRVGGIDFVDIHDLAQQYHFQQKGSVASQTITLFSQWSKLVFKEKERHCFFNNTKIYLNRPIIIRGHAMYISRSDWDNNLRPILFQKPNRLYCIVLDPGHGGRDMGCQSLREGLDEKVLTFDLAKRVQTLLLKRGYRVHLTRYNDVFVPLEDRVALAKKYNADLFLSIHFNTVPQTYVQGIETYIVPPLNEASSGRDTLIAADREYSSGIAQNPWNVLFGYCLQSTLIKSLHADDRGLKRARFKVLKEQTCPAALIECGFFSHAGELDKIKTTAYRDQIATAIVDAIGTYQQK